MKSVFPLTAAIQHGQRLLYGCYTNRDSVHVLLSETNTQLSLNVTFGRSVFSAMEPHKYPSLCMQ